MATEALAALLAACCEVDSTSAVLAGARYLAALPELAYHDDALARSLAAAANRAVAKIGDYSARGNALDDDAYCAGLYDAPADADDFCDDERERAARLRDVAIALCDRKRLLERHGASGFRALRPDDAARAAAKQKRGRRRGARQPPQQQQQREDRRRRRRDADDD
ncbi:MAG: hypothetical protein AAGH65_07870, partial [Pseudomonadota bacterium]